MKLGAFVADPSGDRFCELTTCVLIFGRSIPMGSTWIFVSPRWLLLRASLPWFAAPSDPVEAQRCQESGEESDTSSVIPESEALVVQVDRFSDTQPAIY
jgi:hypothetical protein